MSWDRVEFVLKWWGKPPAGVGLVEFIVIAAISEAVLSSHSASSMQTSKNILLMAMMTISLLVS